MAIRVIIADDADLVIRGAQAALAACHRLEIVGTARCTDDLLQQVRSQLADVVVLSEWIYPMDVLSTVEALRQAQPGLRIIVMGGLTDGLLIRDLFSAGVSGYLCKSDDLCDLLTVAIDVVLRGRLYLSPTANTHYLLAAQSAHVRPPLDAEARQVLQLLAQGEHAGEISQRLGIDKRRVYWVREKLRRRFSAKTNEHLIQRAVAEGFLCPYD